MVTFAKGKDVYCKKNGLRMTMQAQTVDGRVVCFFINEKGNQAIGVFEASELDPVTRTKLNPQQFIK